MALRFTRAVLSPLSLRRLFRGSGSQITPTQMEAGQSGFHLDEAEIDDLTKAAHTLINGQVDEEAAMQAAYRERDRERERQRSVPTEPGWTPPVLTPEQEAAEQADNDYLTECAHRQMYGPDDGTLELEMLEKLERIKKLEIARKVQKESGESNVGILYDDLDWQAHDQSMYRHK